MELKVKYDNQVAEFKAIQFLKVKTDFSKTNGKSGECFYKGKLKKIITGQDNSYYICRCDKGYMGDNCQISEHLFNETQ